MADEQLHDLRDLLDHDPNYGAARDRQEASKQEATWGDYGRMALSGAAGAVGAVAGMAEYVTDAGAGSDLHAVKKWGEDTARSQFEKMTPGGQRAASADVLPGGEGPSLWDGDTDRSSAIGLKIVGSLPGMVASLLPGGIVAGAIRGTAGAAAGMLASGAVSGAQMGGEVFNGIQKGILDARDADLQTQNDVYRGLRQMGFSEGDAKRQVIDEIVGHKPAIMAAIGAASEQFGAGAAVANKAAGIATRGALASAKHSAVEEAATEAGQNLLQEGLTQTGQIQGGQQQGFDARKAASSVAEGALIGGIMGGGVGAVTGAGNRSRTVTVDQPGHAGDAEAAAVAAATGGDIAPPVVPPAPAPAPEATPEIPAQDETGAPTTPTLQGEPVETPAARAKRVSRKRSTVTVVESVAPDAAAAIEQAAPVTQEPAQAPSVSALSPSPVAQEPAGTAPSAVADPLQSAALPAEPAAQADVEPTAPVPVPPPTPEVVTAAVPESVIQLDTAKVEAARASNEAVQGYFADEVEPDAPEVPAEPILQGEPVGRRVLKAQTEQSLEAEQAWVEQNREVDRENLKAKGITPAKKGARTRDWKLLRPDVLEAEKTDRPFLSRAKQAIAEVGEAAPSYYREGLEGRGEARAAARQAELQAAMEQHAERQSKAEAAQTAVDTGHNEAVTGSVQTKREAERLEKAAALAEQNEKARAAIQSIPPNQALEQKVTKADPAAKRALRQRLDAILFQARDAGVEIPATVQKNTPAYIRELHNIQRTAKLLAENKLRPAQATQFLTDHYLALAGDTKLSRAVREQEADTASRRAPTAEEAVLGASEGTGDTDAGPRRHAAEPAAIEDSADARPDEVEDAGTLEADEPAVVARERPAVAVDVAKDVVAGQNKAGTFAVATSKRRSVTPPGKGLGAALKATNRNPTPAQAAAGNYAKGRAEVAGLKISIENPKGSVRRGVDADGKPWETKMPAHYGDVRGSKGADGDPIDVYLAPGASTQKDPKVFVVDQVDPATGKFDEHKAVIGAKDEAAAREIYEGGFSDGSGKERVGGVTEMTAQEFRDFTKEPQTKPAAEGALVRKPAAMLSEDRAAALIEAELLAGLEQDLDAYTPTVMSYGIEVPVRETRSLDAMLKGNGFDTLKGINKVLSPFFAKRLREMVGTVPVHIVAKGDMARLTSRFIADGQMADVPLGYYDPNAHQIVLREDATTTQAARNHLLLHEATHAAFMGTIEANPDVENLLDIMRMGMREAMPESHRNLYGFTNAHEFASEMFSSAQFQQLAARVPTPPGVAEAIDGALGRPSTLWGLFVGMVRRFLNVPRGTETMLESVIRVGEGMVRLREDALQSTALPRALQAEDVRSAVTDRVSASGDVSRKLALKVSTLDQIRQGFRTLFPSAEGSHLDTVVENIQRIGPMVERMQRRGEDFSKRFVELQRSNPKVAQESALLRIDVTMAGVNLIDGPATQAQLLEANPHLGKDRMTGWQGKAQLASLQERFMRLPADVRAAMMEESRWYGETQDRIAAAITENVLDTVADLDPAKRQELTAKTLAGTLEDGDKDLVGATVFNALKGARELRKTEGMYFPLMRHGDHVVITRDRVEVPAGAVEIEPGVVEFSGDTERAARVAARAFAEKTPLKVLSVVPVYKDPTTGERLAKVDATALADYDVTYRVIVQHRGAHFFDTRTEAERFRREAGSSYREMSEALDRDQFAGRSDLMGSQLSSLVNSVRARTDVAEGTRKLLEGMVYQAAVRMMSGNRIQHRSLPRRMVQGASADYARNTLSYAHAASSYLGKLTYLPKVREALSAMRSYAESRRLEKGAAARQQLLHEIQSRVDSNVTDLSQPSKAMQTVLTLSYLTRLFGPSHSILNATQPLMMTYPVLAGRHGAARAAYMLTRAYRSIGAHTTIAQGIGNTKAAVAQWSQAGIDTSDMLGSIKRNLTRDPDGAQLGRVLDEMADRGIFADAANFEIGRAIADGSGKVGQVLAKTDRIARQLPGAVEAVNRAVTAVSAYRLARMDGKSEADARTYAIDTVFNTQGDYSNTNAAPFFNKYYLRPMLQFKKYAQMATFLWADMARRAFGPGTSRAERYVALKQFGNLAAVQVAMAGALSLPGLEIVKVVSIAAGALGIGGGYDDIERKLRRVAEESLGKTWAELVTRGVITRAIGVDLSSRLSMADLWTYGEPRDYTNAGMAAYIGMQMGGAPLGLLLDYKDAFRSAQEGKFLDAAIKAVPAKFVSDFGKAYRGMDDEKQLSFSEAASTAMGLRPARIANEQQARSDSIEERRAKQDTRYKLVRAYREARGAGERARVTSQIREYNKGVGLRDRIFPKTLDRYRPTTTTGATQ